ncbi:hypothetical protein Mgra_00010077 [Meloidogyne graminicola]|uniref:Uncharacterized protein n=1 Tax=Meloidogyne graminicola TaxID=189291 RepID=A0A8S9Z7T0_9BILA|nr:hypothetical protein Mgra_00010077 [Meloidogyne graminicola]
MIKNGGNDVEDRSIVSKTRYFLTSVCSLLECVRQCNVTPSIVFILFFSESKEECLLQQFDDFKQINPIVKCKVKNRLSFFLYYTLYVILCRRVQMNIKLDLLIR